MALRIAAADPGTVRAMASFHGGALFTDKPDSPHHSLNNRMGRLYFEHAENDASMPPEAIEKFDAALAASGVRYDSRRIIGVRHGWTVSDHATYDAQKSEESFQALLSLFKAEL
jgi:carboxymethylenebutenolidase